MALKTLQINDTTHITISSINRVAIRQYQGNDTVVEVFLTAGDIETILNNLNRS